MIDLYIYAIVALLPLSACMVVFQTNPYNALILRGILGALAALTYGILGAADVALTEALMGTLLAITLYAVAVRSSMVMRLGLIAGTDSDQYWQDLLAELHAIFDKFYLRVELINYQDQETLNQALIDREIHAVCLKSALPEDRDQTDQQLGSYQIKTRLQRLYEIMQGKLLPGTELHYVNLSANKPEDH